MAIFPGSAIPSAAGGYTIDQSMYFGDAPSTSPKLSRQFDETGSTSPKWTFATWWKKGQPTTSAKTLYYFRPLTVNAGADVEFTHANDLPGEGAGFRSNAWSGSSSPWDWNTNLKDQFRDYSAWYHVCHVIDYQTSPYVFLYINGVLQDINTIYGTKSGAGYGTNYSPVSGDTFFIGSNYSNQCGNAYFADTYWIEQQALNPVGTFGEFDEDTGQFVPTKYTGTYSGNSFYLDYADSSNFGTDRSGLGNNFTVANIAATQQKLDSPTNNYPVWNVLWGRTGKMPNTSEGNLEVTSPEAAQAPVTATFGGLVSGKWYTEVLMKTASGDLSIGVLNTSGQMTDISTANGHAYRWYNGNGNKQTSTASTSAYGNSYTSGDIIGIALDMDNGAIYFSKNGTWQNSGDPTSGASKTGAAFTDVLSAVPDTGWVWNVMANNTSVRYVLNAGSDSSFAGNKTAQGNGPAGTDFYYDPPTDYKALRANSLPDPEIAKPSDHFQTVIYTGDGSNPKTISGVGFASDMIWLKSRGHTNRHNIYDTVRGIPRSGSTDVPRLSPDDNTVSGDTSDELRTVTSDGFTVDSSRNGSGNTFVAWCWKAGGTASSNTNGSITSTVSANTAAGFSICKFENNNTSGATIGHGLSKAPEVIWTKHLEDQYSWYCYHKSMDGSAPEDYVMYLDHNGGRSDTSETWNDTAPTATVFTLGNEGSNAVGSRDVIAYCWHSVPGFSAIGSYVGNNNADGPFVFLNFRPRLILVKTYSTGNWLMYDSVRDPYNPGSKNLYADTDATEGTINNFNFYSNGFKPRSAGWNNLNSSSGYTYTYMAFAESPFQFSRGR